MNRWDFTQCFGGDRHRGQRWGSYAYVFSNINGQIRPIFDSEVFNEAYSYHVSYKDQYKAQVTSLQLRKRFILDLQYKGKEYLSEIYGPNGTLKEPIQGWVNPVSGLYPIDFDRDGSYELQALQAIADRLGYVQTTLKWNGRVFAPQDQHVAIFGGNL